MPGGTATGMEYVAPPVNDTAYCPWVVPTSVEPVVGLGGITGVGYTGTLGLTGFTGMIGYSGSTGSIGTLAITLFKLFTVVVFSFIEALFVCAKLEKQPNKNIKYIFFILISFNDFN